jgi:hypothetical protein
MATAQELFNFLSMAVLEPALQNQRADGLLRRKIGRTKRDLIRLARLGRGDSIIRYVLNSFISPQGVDTWQRLSAINATTFEDVVSTLLLIYRRR